MSGSVYKIWYLDALEGSFALNLIVLNVATYHVQLSGGNQLVVGYTSVSIALIQILASQIFQQLRHNKLWKKIPEPNLKFKKLNTNKAEDNMNNPTIKFYQLCESLLQSHSYSKNMPN